MRVEQERVRQFMEDKLGQVCPNTPTLTNMEAACFRDKLLDEERKEYLTAVAEKDLAGIADAIGDMLYIVLGTAVDHGIDIQPVFDEVHRSNMTKKDMDPVTRKGGKGPGFQEPRLAEILLVQMTRLADAVSR